MYWRHPICFAFYIRQVNQTWRMRRIRRVLRIQPESAEKISCGVMIAIEIFLVRFDEKFFSKVCLKIFEQGPTKKFQAGSGWSPGFFHDREKFHGSEFIQIRLTFYNQGLLKIFQSKSAEKISSKVWLIRIRFFNRDRVQKAWKCYAFSAAVRECLADIHSRLFRAESG